MNKILLELWIVGLVVLTAKYAKGAKGGLVDGAVGEPRNCTEDTEVFFAGAVVAGCWIEIIG